MGYEGEGECKRGRDSGGLWGSEGTPGVWLKEGREAKGWEGTKEVEGRGRGEQR